MNTFARLDFITILPMFSPHSPNGGQSIRHRARQEDLGGEEHDTASLSNAALDALAATMTGKMGSKLSSWLSLLLLGSGIHAYFDAGEATIPAAIETFIPTIPHHLSRLEYATVTFGANALISAVAPLVTAKPNGGYETYYSMHYNRGAPAQRDRLGKGIFKRGVFADDPPFPTCTPCDGSGSASITRTFNGSTTFSSAPECTTIPYNVSSCAWEAQ